MKNKSLTVLALIFAVLVGLLAAQSYLPNLWPKNSPYLQKLKTLNKQNLDRFELNRGQESLVLEKNDNTWKINSSKVAQKYIDELFNGIFVSVEPEITAQTDKRHTDLGVTTDRATRIKLSDKISLLVGKANYPGVFARFDGDNVVYLLKNLDPGRVSLDAQDWLDKTIFSLDPNKLQSLTFNQKNKDLIISKKDGKWIIEENGKEVVKEKMDDLISDITALASQSVVQSNTDIREYSTLPELKLTIIFDGGTETLELFKGKSNYLVKRNSDGQQFITSEQTLSKILSAHKNIVIQ